MSQDYQLAANGKLQYAVEQRGEYLALYKPISLPFTSFFRTSIATSSTMRDVTTVEWQENVKDAPLDHVVVNDRGDDRTLPETWG